MKPRCRGVVWWARIARDALGRGCSAVVGVVSVIPPLSLSNVCSSRVGHGTGLVRPQHTEGPGGNPVDVYGVLDWLATSARDLLAPDIGHAMLRMQHAVSPTGMV